MMAFASWIGLAIVVVIFGCVLYFRWYNPHA